MDFDPRQKSYGHACYWGDPGEVGVVWRETVVVRSVVKPVVRYHSLDELDEVQIQSEPRSCAATIAAPWVNASVLETPFPSLA